MSSAESLVVHCYRPNDRDRLRNADPSLDKGKVTCYNFVTVGVSVLKSALLPHVEVIDELLVIVLAFVDCDSALYRDRVVVHLGGCHEIFSIGIDIMALLKGVFMVTRLEGGGVKITGYNDSSIQPNRIDRA